MILFFSFIFVTGNEIYLIFLILWMLWMLWMLHCIFTCGYGMPFLANRACGYGRPLNLTYRRLLLTGGG